MKKIVALGLLASSSVFSGEYIVKMNPQIKSNLKLSTFGEVKNLNLSFGTFSLLKTENKASVDFLKNNPAVSYIEPNYTYTKFDAPKDTDFSKQWGLNNDGKNSGSWWSRGTAGVDVSALEAWKITKGSVDIKIAVIDTGVDYTHEDLKNNILINEAELNGSAGVDDDGNGFIDDIYGYDFANDDSDPMDGHGHGTHCAGVIGAEHNSLGIAGINAHVKILPIKFLKDNGSGTLEGALKAIDYAISRGVQIMSNSWGGGGRSQSLYEAIERAEQAGISFIAAAGNSSLDMDKKASYPASYDLANITAVGALDGKGNKASFSNYGKATVHVFAPGVDIYSTVSGDGYKKMSGTSMACPHVAGVAGLILANEPNLSYAEVKARLMSTSIQTENIEDYAISGYVDANNALLNLTNQ